MQGKLKPNRNLKILLIAPLLVIFMGCSRKTDKNKNNGVYEISQTIGSDGYYLGSFIVPYNGISFLLSIFKDNNASIAFYSITDPDGINILSRTSTPNLYYDASGSSGSDLSKAGYSNVLVPQSTSFNAKPGKWIFKAYNNDSVKLTLRSGAIPSNASIVIQPFITGTTWVADNLSNALDIMYDIYSSNGITLSINDTITINESKFAEVSGQFTDPKTSSLLSQGITNGINIFFIQDYPLSWSGILGNAAGIPGSMGISSSWNGVLISLSAHASGTTLDAQLLGETAAHEMGHQVGLFHTSESGGTIFDILSDTEECSISLDSNSNGKVSPEECDRYGADNVMFWAPWSQLSRSSGKKQNVFSNHQNHVIKYSPIAR